MRRTATIAQTKTKGFTIRGQGHWSEKTLTDSLAKVSDQGFEWVRFRPLTGASDILQCYTTEAHRFAVEFDRDNTAQAQA